MHLVASVGVISLTATTAAAPGTARAAEQTVTLPVRDALGQLPVKARTRALIQWTQARAVL